MEIARKYFKSLVLDAEYDDIVFCRILNDGWYVGTLSAPSKELAIEKFLSGNYEV